MTLLTRPIFFQHLYIKKLEKLWGLGDVKF